jgi:hypothetical protein
MLSLTLAKGLLVEDLLGAGPDPQGEKVGASSSLRQARHFFELQQGKYCPIDVAALKAVVSQRKRKSSHPLGR